MNVRQRSLVSRFEQILSFLDDNSSVIPPAAVAGQRQTLTTAIGQINGFAQDQVLRGNETVLAQTVSSARIAVRDTFMRQLVTAAQLHLTGKNPGDPIVPRLSQVFALPQTRTNGLALVSAAKSMRVAAAPYASIFASAGVNLDQMDAAIKALQAAIDAENAAKRTAKGATAGIIAQIKAGQGAVRMMDVVIRPLIAPNKALVKQWDFVKRSAGGLNLATPEPVPAQSAGTPTSSTDSTSSTGSATTSAAPSSSTSQPAAPSGSSAPAAG